MSLMKPSHAVLSGRISLSVFSSTRCNYISQSTSRVFISQSCSSSISCNPRDPHIAVFRYANTVFLSLICFSYELLLKNFAFSCAHLFFSDVEALSALCTAVEQRRFAHGVMLQFVTQQCWRVTSCTILLLVLYY